MIGFGLRSDGPLSILCLAAHPDDVEIGCGGALLELAGRGEASWLTLSGTPERRAEATAAAEAFWPGADQHFHDFPDGRFPAHWDEVKSVLHTFAAEHPTPDVVFAPRHDDAHQDHRLLGTMAPTVWRDSLVLHYEIPKWDGDLTTPSSYVPVSDQRAERKWQLLDEHYVSQHGRDWWDRDVILGLMRVRGVECHRRYAEGFHVRKSVIDLGRA